MMNSVLIKYYFLLLEHLYLLLEYCVGTNTIVQDEETWYQRICNHHSSICISILVSILLAKRKTLLKDSVRIRYADAKSWYQRICRAPICRFFNIPMQIQMLFLLLIVSWYRLTFLCSFLSLCAE
ncbi:hypothetical protein Pint_21609 [Pistacia integerrima]|uniref:Uncharacterized protein n=1 Tax=Pistacia integerrima TaxID=434235 RepID=A0ACC0XCN2_9ROSI|nr:hypothetical protein Pint_21609 [Pistacia integerrima]